LARPRFFKGLKIMGSKPKLLSGSRAAGILNLSDWTTPLKVWQLIQEDRSTGFNKKNGYKLPDPVDNAAVRWGSAFEMSNIVLTEEHFKKKIVNREKMYRKNFFCTCHVDGEIGNKLYEGKTTSYYNFRNKFGEPGTDKIPRHNQLQIQHNMYVADFNECILSVLVFPDTPDNLELLGWEVKKGLVYSLQNDREKISPFEWATTLKQMGFFHTYHIKRNNDLIHEMLEQYNIFWNDYILKEIPPEPVNTDDIKRLCPQPVGTIVIDDPFLLEVKQELDTIKKEISKSGKLGKRIEQLKALFLDGVRKLDHIIDDDSTDKYIFLDTRGKKIGQWGKNKNGSYMFK
jgi:predicted phage-related endonuclease